MDFLIAIILVVGSALGAVAGNLAANEVYDWASIAASRIIERALTRLPRSERQRYREEWTAHLAECGGHFGKLVHAFGCLLASNKMPAASASDSLREKEIEPLLLKKQLVLAKEINTYLDELRAELDSTVKKMSSPRIANKEKLLI